VDSVDKTTKSKKGGNVNAELCVAKRPNVKRGKPDMQGEVTTRKKEVQKKNGKGEGRTPMNDVETQVLRLNQLTHGGNKDWRGGGRRGLEHPDHLKTVKEIVRGKRRKKERRKKMLICEVQQGGKEKREKKKEERWEAHAIRCWGSKAKIP